MSEQGPGHDEQQQQGGPQPGHGRENLAELYETMSRMFRENLERAGTLTEEAFDRALRETREWAARLRENYRDAYADDVSRVADYIRRDWEAAIRFTQEQYRRNFDLDRLQAGALGVLSRLAQSAGAQLEAFAARVNERLSYKTGEIAGAGTLQCTQCEQLLIFDKATRIPPCPRCHGTQFRRSF
jgi:Zinc-ribbon containing domain